MDLESVRQFILSDEKIKEYFLSLAGKENSGQSAHGTIQNPSLENGSEDSTKAAELENAVLRKKLKAAQEQAAALEGECVRLRETLSQTELQKNAAVKQLKAPLKLFLT